MRTLTPQEATQVAGSQAKIVVDVNIPAKYVHVNLVDGDKVTVLANIDWSKFGKQA